MLMKGDQVHILGRMPSTCSDLVCDLIAYVCSALPVLLAVHAYVIQVTAQLAHASAKQALVHLNLLLTHTFRSASRLPLQMCPHARQSGQLILTLCQLYLDATSRA